MSRTIRTRLIGTIAALSAAITVAAAVAVPATASAHATRTYGATTLTLDPQTAAALQSLGVTPGVIAPATANSDGSLSFPITSPLSAALRTGTITHSGGISLTAGSTTVDLTDFDINVLPRTLTAEVGGARVPILRLDFGAARLRFVSGQLVVGPVSATLTQTAASALNSVFGVTAFTPGLELGTATVAYQLF